MHRQVNAPRELSVYSELTSDPRPGFGGSTPVTIDVRMKVWLETVPALLQTLQIKHVSLMTHSAGAIYTLNTLLHFSAILTPRAPTVAFLGLSKATLIPLELTTA